jgi:hypothetical protein
MTNVIDTGDNNRKAKLAASAIARAAHLKQERLTRPAPVVASTVAQAERPAPRWLAFLMAMRKR